MEKSSSRPDMMHGNPELAILSDAISNVVGEADGVSNETIAIIAGHLIDAGWVSKETVTEIQRRARDEGWLESKAGVALETDPYLP